MGRMLTHAPGTGGAGLRRAAPKIEVLRFRAEAGQNQLAKILTAAGYTGYVSLEMEGKQDPDVAVPKSVVMLRKAFSV